MSNPQGVQGACQRRSSIAANAHVQEELKNIVPQDVFRMSEFNLSNMTRLSGNSQRGSIPRRPNGSSGIPTPSLRNTTITIGSSAAAGVSLLSSANRNVTFQNSVSAPQSKRRPVSVVPSRPPTNNSSASRPSVPIAKKPAQGPQNILHKTALNNARRKSKSQETLSFLQTPSLYTPARSRSKSPCAMSTTRRGLHNEKHGGDVGKCINVTKDKTVMTEMSKFVFEFLESLDCPWMPTSLKEFINSPTRLPSAKYVGMIKFLAAHFGADCFFTPPKGEKYDEEEKIIEFAKLLKYPGTLSKSHLKTPTVQHAWAGSLTFLTWLCCRTAVALTSETEGKPIDELNLEKQLQEMAFQSYLTLFPLHFKNQLTPEHIDLEMENFRLRIRDTQAAEISQTKEELIEERNARLAELESLNKEPDPAKEVRIRLHAEIEAQSILNTKIHEVENECKKYSNCNHLKLQLEGIQLELNTKTAELKRLKQQVDKQPLSNQEASAMKSETETLKKQLESSRHINSDLKVEYETRQKKLIDFQKEFYELCKAFGIVERYNENLRFLRLEGYSIPPNPFAPKELEEWMKSVSKNLQRSQGRVNEMQKEVTASSKQKEKENQQFQQEMIRLTKEIDDLNNKLQSVEKYTEFIERDYEQKQLILQTELDELNNELQGYEEKLKKEEEEKEAADCNLNECKKRLEEHQKLALKGKAKLDEELAKYALYKEDLDKFLQDMVTKAAQTQQSFYLKHFGVDIFEGFPLGK